MQFRVVNIDVDMFRSPVIGVIAPFQPHSRPSPAMLLRPDGYVITSVARRDLESSGHDVEVQMNRGCS
jgi:hypothetical protein